MLVQDLHKLFLLRKMVLRNGLQVTVHYKTAYLSYTNLTFFTKLILD